jgi:hypothetical protein
MNLCEEIVLTLSDEQYDRYADLRRGGVTRINALISVEGVQ